MLYLCIWKDRRHWTPASLAIINELWLERVCLPGFLAQLGLLSGYNNLLVAFVVQRAFFTQMSFCSPSLCRFSFPLCWQRLGVSHRSSVSMCTLQCLRLIWCPLTTERTNSTRTFTSDRPPQLKVSK